MSRTSRIRHFAGAFVALCCAAGIIGIWMWLGMLSALIVSFYLGWEGVELIDKHVVGRSDDADFVEGKG